MGALNGWVMSQADLHISCSRDFFDGLAGDTFCRSMLCLVSKEGATVWGALFLLCNIVRGSSDVCQGLLEFHSVL